MAMAVASTTVVEAQESQYIHPTKYALFSP